jgi:hypothetical protein
MGSYVTRNGKVVSAFSHIEKGDKKMEGMEGKWLWGQL